MKPIKLFDDYLNMAASKAEMSREEYTATYLSVSEGDELIEKNFQVVTSGHAIKYRLSYQYGKGGFLAIASSSKENDKEIEIDDVFEIGKAIEDSINDELKKRKQLFTVEEDHGYQGAGYAFYLVMDDVIKLLNK
mgnify:CR=1 FL=1|tara:strand:+ start:856 stop:1260 length:405 start_codon:yes stop_codon:yes gene_type:complete